MHFLFINYLCRLPGLTRKQGKPYLQYSHHDQIRDDPKTLVISLYELGQKQKKVYGNFHKPLTYYFGGAERDRTVGLMTASQFYIIPYNSHTFTLSLTIQ